MHKQYNKSMHLLGFLFSVFFAKLSYIIYKFICVHVCLCMCIFTYIHVTKQSRIVKKQQNKKRKQSVCWTKTTPTVRKNKDVDFNLYGIFLRPPVIYEMFEYIPYTLLTAATNGPTIVFKLIKFKIINGLEFDYVRFYCKISFTYYYLFTYSILCVL